MYSAGLVLIGLLAAVNAMPQSVRMFDIEKAPMRLRFDPYDVTWEQFKQEYGKNYYGDNEHDTRKGIFMDNIKKMEEHNWRYFQMETSYYLGVNQFADMTFDEFKKFNKLQKSSGEKQMQCSTFQPPLNWVQAAEVDWRTKGYVTPVKNQGQCGSCWSFSTTGSLEGQVFRKTGKLISLSEQQLVDCSAKFGNNGCEGGLMDYAFAYIKANGGLEDEADYPYTAQDDTCKFDKSEVKADLASCVDVTSGDETALAQALASQGPISVAIDASHQSFQLYKGGVYDEPECSSTELDHGVLAVGYGSMKGQEYYIVKNSWGTTWGDEGYVMMSRNKENQCGIATSASYPVE